MKTKKKNMAESTAVTRIQGTQQNKPSSKSAQAQGKPSQPVKRKNDGMIGLGIDHKRHRKPF